LRVSVTALKQATPVAATPQIPVHVAIIMDGNRRWARARGRPPVFGHQRGADAVRRAVEACGKLGIRYLTLFAFSSENWQRPEVEVTELMGLLRFYLRKEIESLHKNEIKLRVIGDRSRLDRDILELIDNAERLTSVHRHLELIIALNYGARDEIVRATRRLAKAVLEGELPLEAIDHSHFAAALDTTGVPDPDLLIRTSGEQRVSNFLLWQLAYTEFVFLDIHWPDFAEEHLRQAVEEYGRRERRYGASSG
jgi:undecaprenyl diphosphate synthase